MRRLLRKLRSERGESLTEVLVSTLIAAVALTMLASMVSTGSRFVSQSRDRLTAYYEAGNALAAQTPEADQPVIELKLKNGDAAVSLTPDGGGIEAYAFVNDTLGGDGVAAYRWKEN